MIDNSPIKASKFKGVIFLILFLGILTNISIASLLIFLSAYQALFSPIIGSIVFTVCYILVDKDRLTVKNAFLITAYAVVGEVLVHTHYIGWGAGFYYYFYALSVVFILDFSWKPKPAIIFNSSMVLLTIYSYKTYNGIEGVYSVSEDFLSIINTVNLAMIGTIILVIMIYSSHINKTKDSELAKKNLALNNQNDEMIKQKNHLEILLKEVHHRVRNNLQVISSLLSLQQNTIKDEKVLSSLVDAKTRIEAIAIIHQNLYVNNTGNEVDFDAYLRDLIESQQVVQSNIQYKIETNKIILGLDLSVPLGLIVSELMTNSMKHAFKGIANPMVDISLKQVANDYQLIFSDNGIGLPPDFGLSQSNSLGMEIITALTEQIEGTMTFKNNDGARFCFAFIQPNTIKTTLPSEESL